DPYKPLKGDSKAVASWRERMVIQVTGGVEGARQHSQGGGRFQPRIRCQGLALLETLDAGFFC
ncbi:MAG: hypothetical protein QM500_18050, partial [Methylococcales bacterium]